MLCNPRNQVGWPEVITKEVVENLHKFIANVYVTIGQGLTLVPLSAQLELTLPLSAQLKLTLSPTQPNEPWMWPKVAQVEL